MDRILKRRTLRITLAALACGISVMAAPSALAGGGPQCYQDPPVTLFLVWLALGAVLGIALTVGGAWLARRVWGKRAGA